MAPPNPPPPLSLQVYGSVVGLFELNNLGLSVCSSPVEDFFLAVDEEEEGPDKAAVCKVGVVGARGLVAMEAGAGGGGGAGGPRAAVWCAGRGRVVGG